MTLIYSNCWVNHRKNSIPSLLSFVFCDVLLVLCPNHFYKHWTSTWKCKCANPFVYKLWLNWNFFQFKIPEADFEAIIQNNTSLENQNRILDNCAKNLPVRNVTVAGSIRFCEKCRTIKPDRTHHCSVCGECVLKMDHHCPWINNCVCFTNYKYFVLFLGYALLYCIYICLTSVRYFIAFWKVCSVLKHIKKNYKIFLFQGDLQGMGRFNILFLFFVAIMFGVSLMSLFGYHCYLVLENRTTLGKLRDY